MARSSLNNNKFIPGKTRVLYEGVAFGKRERKAINKILDKNWWGLHTEGKLFEEELAKIQSVKRAILTNSSCLCGGVSR